MGSVIATWKGKCPSPDVQRDLISYLQLAAQQSDARWSAAPDRPAFLELLTKGREEGLPSVPNIRLFDQELSGRILIRTDLSPDAGALVAEATRHGVDHEIENPARPGYSALRVESVRVRGPRGLYPGSDRMSFIFLQSDAAPFLDGYLATVDGRDWCAASDLDLIKSSDWYVQCPFVHLRYFLEQWFDMLFAWIKFFFIPDLSYWRYDDLPHYPELRDAFENTQSAMGSEQAKKVSFNGLLDAFQREADRWSEEMKSW
jgi:hypothetical protein